MKTKKEYIMLTDKIRRRIKEERKARKIRSVHFSTQVLGKSTAYLSHIETGIVETIEREDLKKIFENMLDIHGEELDKYVDELVIEPQEGTEQSTDFSTESKEPNDPEIVYYDKNNKAFTKAGFDKMLDNIVFMFNMVYEKNPQYAFNSAGILLRNLSSDVGFTLGINSIPFFLLEKVDRDIKQNLFDEIGDVVKKYFDEYAATKDSKTVEE